MPANVEHNMPQHCLMDRDRLKNIEILVSSINEKFDKLSSHDGPIADIKNRLSGVEGSSDRAHQRIDNLRILMDTEIKKTNGFIAKVMSFAGGLSAAISLIIAKWLG